MKEASATILEIFNHIVQSHPEYISSFSSLLARAEGKDQNDIIKSQLIAEWASRNFSMPCPHFIKQANVLRHGNKDATWIETGTYLGDTTALLAETGNMVYSIEPEPTLFKNAALRFNKIANVKIINGLSENILPTLLPTLRGNVNFWLDGHYSAGITHQGPKDTPLIEELNSIALNLNNMNLVVIMVDDIRVCDKSNINYDSAYPDLDYLVNWARSNNLSWRIELDSFIAQSH